MCVDVYGEKTTGHIAHLFAPQRYANSYILLYNFDFEQGKYFTYSEINEEG